MPTNFYNDRLDDIYSDGPTCEEITDENRKHKLEHDKSLAFIMAGNATVTFVSKKTGARFTFRIQAPHKEGNEGTNAARDVSSQMRFVQVLTGQDNENSYRYLGYIKRGVFFHGGAKAKIGADAPSAKAFAWAFKTLTQGGDTSSLEIWHEGRCGRCARKLTVPDSVASGYGPECINHVF
jgi:hypothetical protein